MFKLLLGLIHHWKGLDMKITDFGIHHDPTPSGEFIPSQTSNFKHGEVGKVSDKPIYDTLLEGC